MFQNSAARSPNVHPQTPGIGPAVPGLWLRVLGPGDHAAGRLARKVFVNHGSFFVDH